MNVHDYATRQRNYDNAHGITTRTPDPVEVAADMLKQGYALGEPHLGNVQTAIRLAFGQSVLDAAEQGRN